MKRNVGVVLSAALMAGLLVGCTDEVGSDDDPREESGGEEVAESADALSIHGYGWTRVRQDQIIAFDTRNSTGGAVTSGVAGLSRWVRFDGIPYSPAVNVQVSGPDGSAPCWLAAPPYGTESYTEVLTRCRLYSSLDLFTDSVNVFIESHSGADVAPRRGAFFSTLGGTTPTVLSSWSSAGAVNSYTWDAANQEFDVSLPDLGFENAAVHVTAIGVQTSGCKVLSWSQGVVRVRCYDHDDNPTSNAGFSLTYQEGSLTPGHVGGHAWVSNGVVHSSYSATVGRHTCGSPPLPSIRPGWEPGHAIVSFHETTAGESGEGLFSGMVTAYGNADQRCDVEDWWVEGTSLAVHVSCYNFGPSWYRPALAEMQLTISATSRFSPKVCPF